MDNLTYQKYLHIPTMFDHKKSHKFWHNVAFGGHMNLQGIYDPVHGEEYEAKITKRLRDHHKLLSKRSQQSMKFTLPHSNELASEFTEDERQKLLNETEYFLPFKSVTLIQESVIQGGNYVESGRNGEMKVTFEKGELPDQPIIQICHIEESDYEDDTGSRLYFGNLVSYMPSMNKFFNDPNIYMYSFRKELLNPKVAEQKYKKKNFIQRLFSGQDEKSRYVKVQDNKPFVINAFNIVKDGVDKKFDNTNYQYAWNEEKMEMEYLESADDVKGLNLYSFWLDHSPFVDITDISADIEGNDTYTNPSLNQTIARIVGMHQSLSMLLQFPQIVATEKVEGISHEQPIFEVRGNYKHSEMLFKPKYEHKILKLNLYDNATNEGGEANGNGKARSLHAVRKHLRRLPNGKLTWVKAHFRGNREVGIITKDYEIDARR